MPAGKQLSGGLGQSHVTDCQIWAHPPGDTPQLFLPWCHLWHVCVASVPRCRGGVLVRRLAWAPQNHKEAGIALCHLVGPDVLPFPLPVYLN